MGRNVSRQQLALLVDGELVARFCPEREIRWELPGRIRKGRRGDDVINSHTQQTVEPCVKKWLVCDSFRPYEPLFTFIWVRHESIAD